jgi:ribosomal protein S18 acetylase RimI-like enzyme
MNVAYRLGPLAPAHRTRVAEIVRDTKVFRDEEVFVALEVFDSGMESGMPNAESGMPKSNDDYSLLGLFGIRHSAFGIETSEEELVGYAAFGPADNTDRTFDLYWIAVDPAEHGRGAGTLLLNGVEDALRERDARLAVVETSSRSEYADTRRFYARRGYSEVARVREFYAPADDRVIYTKRLASPVSGHGVAE